MKKRSSELEIMDLDSSFYTKQEYFECLNQLDQIGKYLGCYKQMIQIFSCLPYKIESILDIGCGGGLFTLKLAKKFINAKVLGIDISTDAIEFAKHQQKKLNINNVDFKICTSELNEPKKSFDIITSTLVLHHLNDQDIVNFLKNSANIANKTIIINDLHRHWFSYYMCSLLFPIFTSNRLILNDSLLSIKKSFTFNEWNDYLKTAGFSSKNYKINWHWPFRWIVRIDL